MWELSFANFFDQFFKFINTKYSTRNGIQFEDESGGEIMHFEYGHKTKDLYFLINVLDEELMPESAILSRVYQNLSMYYSFVDYLYYWNYFTLDEDEENLFLSYHDGTDTYVRKVNNSHPEEKYTYKM